MRGLFSGCTSITSGLITILPFMSNKNLMLSRVEHEKSFITLGPGHPFNHHTYDQSLQC